MPSQVDIEFHGVLYTITIRVHGEEVLTVEIEDKDTLDRWRGEFAAKCKQPAHRKFSSLAYAPHAKFLL